MSDRDKQIAEAHYLAENYRMAIAHRVTTEHELDDAKYKEAVAKERLHEAMDKLGGKP